MQEELRLEVDAAMQGTRIDRLLAERFPHITRSRFQKLLRDGLVTARGKKVRSAYRVLVGDEIRVRVPPPEPLDLTPTDVPLRIVHEDADLIVVDKPAGIVVHPAAGHWAGTLVHGLLFHSPDLSRGESGRPGIVHRLDKDTSGLLVVAKNDRTHASLSAALQARAVRREYAAVVWGVVAEDEGEVDAPIGRHPTDRKRMAVRERGGRASQTHFWTRERFAFASLLELRLATGRTHQIRVHLSHRGNPVFGDPTYGGRNSRLTQLPAGLRVGAREALECMQRQALHAMRLSFQHPVSGLEMRFESELPEDFAKLLAMLRRLDSGAHA